MNTNEQSADKTVTKLTKVFIVVAILSGIVGFMGVKSAAVDGVAKALCGTFLSLFFIALFFGKSK